MKTKTFLFIPAVCLSATFLLPLSAKGQTPGVTVMADLGPELAMGPIPILRCEEGLHLFGNNNLGATKAVAGPLTLVKNVDLTSPVLRNKMITGKHMERMDVEFLVPNPQPQPPQRLLRIVLFDFFIPEIVLSASGGAAAETVKFEFGKACWVHYATNGTSAYCWNFKAGTSFSPPPDVY